jgi:hypothetical protein
METQVFRRGGEFYVLIEWSGGHEEAGPFDDEADAIEASQRMEAT